VWIAGARSYIEPATRRVLRQSKWQFAFDCFPRGRAPLTLDIAPVLSIESVEYMDDSGDYAPFTDFVADLNSDPVRIAPKPTACWPSTSIVPGAVLVTVIAGYEETSNGYDLPDGLKQAIVSQVRAWWNPHTATQQSGALEPDRLVIDTLIAPFKRLEIIPASLPNRL